MIIIKLPFRIFLIVFRALKMKDKYPMCKDQLAQINCRVQTCKYNTGGGNCSNVSPAITLNNNSNQFVCWSQENINTNNNINNNFPGPIKL
jgi:hypothetical protein